MREKTTSLQLLSLTALFFILSIYAQYQLRRSPNKRITPLTDFFYSESYTQDLGMVIVGARRMAANLAYIQMMQYYGVSSHGDASMEADHHHDEMEESSQINTDRTFKKLADFGFRIIRLDPLFSASILEIAGALSFNQHRPEEALKLLNEAITRDPSFYRYHLYVAAILYKNKGQDQELIRILDETMKYPDCPSLLKNILANLHKKYGHFEKAALIYLDVLQTSHTEEDRIGAQNNLERLLKIHPELLSLPQLRRN